MAVVKLPSGRIKPVMGYLYRFLFIVEKAEYVQYVQPFYLSKTERICTKKGGDGFEGLNPKRLGQFHSEADVYYEMYSTDNDYHKNKAAFLASVIKRLNKKNRIKVKLK